MALWPFRRKSGRKRPRSGAALSDEGPPARAQTEGAIVRADSKKKQRTEPSKNNKLQRRTRTYSFSPGRNDDLGVERRRTSAERAGPSTRRRDEQPSDAAWGRMPTLHHKQSERHPMRRKSSRRKKEERQRAAEIKALSDFKPVRPATDSWTSGRVMKKDSQRAKTGSGFRGQPASDVSLPIPGSVHSSLSSDSDRGAFKVSAFDSLAPRPTLRYAPGTRWTSSRTTDRVQSQRRHLAEKEPIAEETLKDHRRVDDLADDLDARDLRELMEREDRRREKKRQREQDRASRRLARKAEKQKADDAEARHSGTPPPENLERGVAGRELVGLGIDPASVTITTSEPEQRVSVTSERMPDAPPMEDVPTSPPEDLTANAVQPPISSTQRDSNVDLAEQPAPADQARPQDSSTSLPQSSRLAGILRSKKSKSKSTLASDKERVVQPPPDIIDEEGTSRRASWTSEKRGRFSLSSFLRWGGKSRRSSGGPPSFSNTSREEMQAAAAAQTTAQAQAQALAKLQGEDLSSTPETAGGVYISRKPSVGAPLRTKSRFKEDLPDFPMSPPDSRVQSPEAEPPLPPLNENHPIGTGAQPIDIPSNKSRQNPLSPSPEPQSMSMASIDSEASWLSGRVGTRRSAIRDSIARANRLDSELVTDSPTNSTQEDLSIMDDDYLARLAPHRNSGTLQGTRRSEDGRPSSDEEDFARDSGAKWGAVGARPQVVHSHRHDRSTMQSQEGLLNIESGDEEESDSPVTPSAHEKADIQRARSVNLGRGHVRNFSAGSAKLLDVTPRTSVDSKARSPQRRSTGHIA